MARFSRSLLALVAILWVCALVYPVSAQTYTPKAIHFVGAPGISPADLLRISGLHEGLPVTKAEIEAALQKLDGTGSFSDIAYTVNQNALTITLTSAASSQALPVRFANFAWWQPAELERAVEARVPLFHGELPLTGSLTDQVEAVLVDLLRDKGVPGAHVTAMQSTSHAGGAVDSIALSITSPQILVGEMRFDGGPSELTSQLAILTHRLNGQDFDRVETANTVAQSSAEIFEDAGYLDIANDPPTVSAPRKDLDHFVVDEQVTLHPGELYRVSSVDLQPAPPLTANDLHSALTVKSGDPASASELRLAEGYLAQPYRQRAFLLARAEAAVHKDATTHTVTYTLTITPGEQFHFASIDTSSLPPALQSDFARSWHTAAGALMDQSFHDTLYRTLQQLHSSVRIVQQNRLNASDHTVVVILHTAGAAHTAPQPAAVTE